MPQAVSKIICKNLILTSTSTWIAWAIFLSLQADLPRDAQSSLEIVEADVTQPHTLTPTFFSGACSLISATATIVGPKEGDTNDRQKYRQVGSSPAMYGGLWHSLPDRLAIITMTSRLPDSAGYQILRA